MSNSNKPSLRRSGNLDKSKRTVDRMYDRIYIENLLVRMQHYREFNEKRRQMELDIDSESQIQQERENIYQSVQYWEQGIYEDIVIVPSLSLDMAELQKIAGVSHYEERQLYNLMLLKNPRVRIIYITSVPIDPAIIDYYVQLVPYKFVDFHKRLVMFSVNDDSPKPLTQKLLERPRLVNRLKKMIHNTEKACVSCFNSTPLELTLANKLGVSLLATHPDTICWGTKEGSHNIFTESGLPQPRFTKRVMNEVDLAHSIVDMVKNNSDIRKVVVKLNDSFTGEGNALLDLTSVFTEQDLVDLKELKDPDHQEEVNRLADKVLHRFDSMKFASKIEKWDSFKKKIPVMGVLAEEFIEGNSKTSPSGQAFIDKNGHVTVLSTHEQILGGLDKMVYLGCSFPAENDYRLQIQEYTKKIGECLANKGVIDHFGVDFICTKDENNKWNIYCLEINLRQGGTTHPLMIMKFLTEGNYDENTATFVSKGKVKYYVASDNVCAPEFTNLVPHDIAEIFSHHEIHYNPVHERGVIFHLMGALSKFGKVGMTCIADSPDEALQLQEKATSMLKRAATDTQ